MDAIITFIEKYWSLLVVALSTITMAIISVRNFSQKPSEEQLNSIRAWLLSAITLAEKEFGSGTGAIKLSYVYSLFIEKFPYFAKIVPFEYFSLLVDEVLDRFKTLLKSNNNLQNYVASNNEKEV